MEWGRIYGDLLIRTPELRPLCPTPTAVPHYCTPHPFGLFTTFVTETIVQRWHFMHAGKRLTRAKDIEMEIGQEWDSIDRSLCHAIPPKEILQSPSSPSVPFQNHDCDILFISLDAQNLLTRQQCPQESPLKASSPSLKPFSSHPSPSAR